ncbi:MAG: glycosyltransferase [Clostridia bacterium]|nr:glycosyltransferase [Clostridia bacterium]
MKIVQVNVTCGKGSTGKICLAVSQLLNQKGIENYILYSSGTTDYPQAIKYQDTPYAKRQALKSRVFGNYGFNSTRSTKKLISEIEKINPDVIHLHNIHSHNCNLEVFFKYLKTANKKVFWTFHDCWPVTGYCPNFDMVGCEKWKTECSKCVQRKEYSWFFDKSKKLHDKKKKLFSGVDMTIVTPSKWIASVVKQSFLKDYPVKVIYNGIDLDIFKPTPSDFRNKYNLEDKFIILGVAFDWSVRKGIDVFVELSKRLDQRFKIVLVGTNVNIDKQLPSNILSIHKTQNQSELAQIYSACDVFVNPTREEALGLTNIEANACGTPVITFNTGGSPECVDKDSGIVVAKNDIDAIEKQVISLCENNTFSKENCINKAKEFDKNQKFREYIDLYNC